jgi:RNA polymerase sigma factor (sigma-70 family)
VTKADDDTTDPLRALTARAVAGDRAALEAVCTALSGPIYALALRMLGIAQDAEDCTQEILVLVVTHLGQYDGRSRVSTWAYTIASRHLLRARRSRMEERTHRVGDVSDAIELGLAQSEPASLPVGDARLLARDVQRTCTQAMLMCLSREERLAVLLGDLLGATHTVGAAICETTPEAFRQRLSRGRAVLRPILEQQCGLSNPSNPCRCARQAATKQRLGLKLPVYKDSEAPAGLLTRAHEQLGSMARLGQVFAIDPPPAPNRELWHEITQRFPDLLR